MPHSSFVVQNSSFSIQHSSYLMQHPSHLMQNPSLLMQHSYFQKTYRSQVDAQSNGGDTPQAPPRDKDQAVKFIVFNPKSHRFECKIPRFYPPDVERELDDPHPRVRWRLECSARKRPALTCKCIGFSTNLIIFSSKFIIFSKQFIISSKGSISFSVKF